MGKKMYSEERGLQVKSAGDEGGMQYKQCSSQSESH